jgi:hypothetical protein
VDPALADPPTLRNKGQHPVQVLTLGGEVELRRRYFWSARTGGVYPVDVAVGIDWGDVSPGARRVCCSMALAQDFAQAAEDLGQVAGLRVSKERLRQITEREAQQAATARAQGTIPPAWSADQARVGPGGRTRVYVGVDGVMVRTVTQAEKDQRRRDQVARRQQRGRNRLGNLRPLPPARPGSDEGFKEMKIGLFYDQDKARRHLFATQEDHEAFGRLLRQHADAIQLERAAEQLSLTDGGPWIRKQILRHLKHLDATLLDFYHFSEHVWAAATCCLGTGPATRAWVETQLHAIKHTGYRAVLAAIQELRKKVRAPAKLNSLRLLRQYVLERWEMVDYPQALAKGWDIGSGPTEAACKNLTLRLKRTGMKWDADHAAGIMNLIALRESGQWAAYWQTRKAS